MVTNLTQEAKAKWAEAIAARNPETKLKLLREFYSVMPKHNAEDAIFGKVAKRSVFVLLKNLYVPVGNSVKFYVDNKEKFMQDLLKSLGFLRVFTKKFGSEPVQEPLLLNNGSRIIDLAYRIHKDFARNFKFARIWREGSSVKVGKDFRLNDFDVVEIHMD